MDELGKVAKDPDDSFSRLKYLSYVILALLLVLLTRVWFLQVVEGKKFAEQARSNSLRDVPVEAPRGFIYDRNGKVVVKNRPSPTVTMRLEVAKKRPDVVLKLSTMLGMSTADVEKRLQEKRTDPLKPRVIKEDADLKQVAYLKEHSQEFPGVSVEIRADREYLYGPLAAHVLGYVGEVSDTELADRKADGYIFGDQIGKTNVERSYESYLRGLKGSRIVEVDAAGRQNRVVRENDYQPGSSVVLTLDMEVQKAAEEALVRAIGRAHKQKFPKANAAAAVVIDPRNGDVLALASFPTYDPRSFVNGISDEEWKRLNSKESTYPLIDRATEGAYPPGSVLKPVIAYGAYAEGMITAATTYYCGGRWIGFGKKWGKYCWRRSGHGGVALRRALAESCDIYFYNLGYRFYKEKGEQLQHWAREFGFGKETGIDLPNETDGRVPDKAWKKEFNKKRDPKNVTWLPGDTVNISIGQGDFLATPLQVAYAYQAFANGGTLYRPRLVSAIYDPDLKTRRDLKPVVNNELKNKDQLKTIAGGLREVVTNGTAKGAFSGFKVPVAGKTGTAQVYGKDDYAWFVGYAPYDDPKYVVAVVVEQGGHGGSVAAPAVREILASIYKLEDKAPVISDSSR